MTDAMLKAQRVDRALFEKVLAMNPELAHSRTHEQVIALRGRQAGAQIPPTDRSVAAALEQGVRAFLHGQQARLADVEAKQQAELEAIRRAHAGAVEQLRAQTISFFSVLDAQALTRFGAGVLLEHSALLETIGVSPNELLPKRRVP